MVREHLPVIFSPRFNVDDQDLLDPKGELDKIVPLGERSHCFDRVARPYPLQIEKEWRVVCDGLARALLLE